MHNIIQTHKYTNNTFIVPCDVQKLNNNCYLQPQLHNSICMSLFLNATNGEKLQIRGHYQTFSHA